MRHETAIDTVTMKVNFNKEEECISTVDALKRILERFKYYIEDKDKIVVRYKRNNIASIYRGSFSYINQDKEKESTIWYISIKLAGLKRYNHSIDCTANNCLMLICSYLNTHNLVFKITQLDVALNMFTKYENVLALCTKKMPKTSYWKANERQRYDTTSYIEKLESKTKEKEASLRSCLYDKTKKENLSFNLTRFEISFQKKFMSKKKFTIGLILKELNRYHVLYIPNKKKQQKIKDMYDSKEILRKKDIGELRCELYRLHIDINVLIDFYQKIYYVNDKTLESYMI